MTRRRVAPTSGTPLNDALFAALERVASPAVIITQVIAEKAAKAGVPLSADERAVVQRKLDRYVKRPESFRGPTMTLLKREDGDPRKIPISLDANDLKRARQIARERHKHVEPTITKILPSTIKRILDGMKLQWRRSAKAEQRAYAAFTRNINVIWGDAIDLLWLLVSAAGELGQACARRQETRASVARTVLLALHARACQVGEEIVMLMRSGYADAAHARWRTLHEIATVMYFIDAHGDEMAQRFLDHAAIETHKAAHQYQKYSRRLKVCRFPKKAMREFEADYQARITRYGSDFAGSYGWAAPALPRNERPSFTAIEKAVELDHHRPYYKMASYNVHADPKSLLVKLGLLDNDLRLAGPSYFGLETPGCGAAVSLAQSTSLIIVPDEVLDNLVRHQVIGQLCDEVAQAFLSVESRLAQAVYVDLDEVERATKEAP